MTPELRPPDGLTSAGPPTITVTSPNPPPIEHPTSTNPTPVTNVGNNHPGPSLAAKRQRRPSVRLGEIGGDPPYDSHQNHHLRRYNKTWRFHKDPSLAAKTSKIRPLTNLVNGADSNYTIENYVTAAEFTPQKPNIKKPITRTRTNWNKFDSILNNRVGGSGGGGITVSTNAFTEENVNNNEEFRDEGSGNPLLKDKSPVNFVENRGLKFWDGQRGGSRGRVSESNGIIQNDIIEGSYGVREWLIELGLGRYGPVFEIHEVDNEVLPMLTLEDLKDMGINAVGSRRKIYSAICKLREGVL